ncbi:MAG: MBL fold metallo-hydrolase [Woeseiaceae bacterium]
MEMGNNSNVRMLGRRAAIFLVATIVVLGGTTVAEETVSEPEIRVTLLGTGLPVPNPRQFGPSVLVEAGDTKLLFDCGRGCAHRLWNVNHDHLRDTQHLFLTHMHSDHTVGVADLYMNGWNLGRSGPLLVYGPAAAKDFMKYLRLAFEEDVVFRADKQNHSVTREGLSHDVFEVSDGQKIEFGDVTVTAIVVDHYVIKPAFGYRIDAGGYSVVISGDTAYSENLVRHSKGVDVIVHEVFSPAIVRFVRKTFPQEVAADIEALHTLAPDVGRVFSEAETRLGVFTHLDNNPAGIPELIEQTRTTWDGALEVGEDLMVIEIGEEIRVLRPSSEQ